MPLRRDPSIPPSLTLDVQTSGVKVTETLGVFDWLPLRLWPEKFINPFRLNDQAGIWRFTMFPINAGCRYRLSEDG